jgi:hypothetical protein
MRGQRLVRHPAPDISFRRTVDGPKSWATRRRADPAHIFLNRRFQPVINRPAIQAARAARRHQGRHGLYFIGQ